MSVALEYAMALEKKFTDQSEGKFRYQFEVLPGQKFDKIIYRYSIGERDTNTGGSVFAFVEKATGDLIKAATWKAPAKLKNGWATKYNLNTQFDLAVEVADPYGGFLYQ